TSQEATAELARLTEAYRGSPLPTTPTTGAEAARLLESRMADPKWAERVTKGDGPAVAEFNKLSEQARSGDARPNMLVETVDAISDPNALPRAGYETMMEGLRESGLHQESELFIRDLDAGKPTKLPTAGDGAACRQALDRLMKDPEFARDVFA